MRPIPCSQWGYHTATLAAQWWAGASLFPSARAQALGHVGFIEVHWEVLYGHVNEVRAARTDVTFWQPAANTRHPHPKPHPQHTSKRLLGAAS